MLANKFFEYFYDPIVEMWHDIQKGIYHISAIGTSHQELSPSEHSGPCLRQLYYFNRVVKDYADSLGDVPNKGQLIKDFIAKEVNGPETTGNFEMGKIIHEIIQTRHKQRHPEDDIEFALIYKIQDGKDPITIKGSIDILRRYKGMVVDIKTASMYTMPQIRNDTSPTHKSQCILYATIYDNFFRHPTQKPIETYRVVYVKKHNLTTYECDFDYDTREGNSKWNDFISRVKYFHYCTKNTIIPQSEPMKWCKYCKYKGWCREDGPDQIEDNER